MISWRDRLQQIGGRNALSRWSWIVTIPLSMVVSSTYAATPTLAEILTWQSIVLTVHVLLGLAMWVAWKTILPNTDRRSRPVTALAFFGLLGLTRALLMQLAQETVGISGGVFSERLAVNIVGSIVALSAIAIIVDDYRTDEAIVQRLDRARATLTQIRDTEEAALRAADIEVLAGVQDQVTRELTASGATPERIRAVANEIVRPISHQLVEESDTATPAYTSDAEPNVRLTFSQAFGRMRAPAPLAVVIVVQGTILGAVMTRYGPPVALGNLLLGGGLVFMGCLLIQRFLPLPSSPIGRLALLTIALAAVGATATELTSVVITSLSAAFPAALIGVSAGVAGAGLALSLWAAVNAGRQLRQQDMAQAVAQEATEIDRMRTLIEQRRLQAARFLHGTIQGELVAAALRHDDPREVRQLISRRFDEYGSIPVRGANQQVQDVVDAWATVLQITVSFNSDCWAQLDGRPERIELLVDALSEGLTNAVRHASGLAVDVRIECATDVVTLRIVSEGVPAGFGPPGIGLTQLRARGARISLDARDDRTEFVATV